MMGFVLIVALVLQIVTNPYMSINANAAGSHETSGSLSFDNTTLDTKETLTDNGDGTYTFRMEVGADISMTDQSARSDDPHDGYFVASYDGVYLIDLWGGNGANGDDTEAGKGGIGGNGAHIYGEIELKKNQVVYYTLGGHGQPTAEEELGGGANGDGGAMGNISTGSYKVGGGGGYSAVYIFTDYNEFATDYLDENENLIIDGILEDDRITKYIMIAGGGGGGGAGDGWTLLDVEQVGRADGGNAGGFDSVSGFISGTGVVSGTFYVGDDGKSSGTSTDYIGHGGTNEPGKISDTVSTIFKGDPPNDWFGTVDATLTGGAGGAGDMRGGAGGAGYCGGSGGVMSSLLYPIYVGGGGGGSSFVADSVETAISTESTAKLTTENTSDYGGMITINYMGQALDDTDPLVNNVTLRVPNLSDYFELATANSISVKVVKGSTETSYAVLQDTNGYYTTEGIATSDQKLVLEITVKPIDGFAGGNDVPIFADGTNKITINSTTTDESVERLLEDGVSFVNVPLNFTAAGRAVEYSDGIAITHLYDAEQHASLQGKLSTQEYDYIASISDYSVYKEYTDSTKTVATKTDLDANKDSVTNYTVAYTVTPIASAGKAVVGTALTATDITAISIVTPVGFMEGTTTDKLGNYDQTINKTLTYDETSGNYVLNLNVVGTKTETITADTGVVNWSATASSGSYTIPADGYYFLQARGGTGGIGDDYVSGTTLRAAGGMGAAGGLVQGVAYLEEGTVVKYKIGQSGLSYGYGDNFVNGTSADLSGGAGGVGGTYTAFYTTTNNVDNYLLVAAGGGGGGQGAYLIWPDPGGDAIECTDPVVMDADWVFSSSVCDGETGRNKSSNLSAGDGGASGTSYYHDDVYLVTGNEGSRVVEGLDNASITDKLNDTDNNLDDLSVAGYSYNTNPKIETGGSIRISLLQADTLTPDPITFTVSENITNYFAMNSFVVTKADKETQIGLTGSYPTTSKHDEYSTYTAAFNVTPTVTANTDGSYTYAYEYNASLILSPAGKFVGGNDVPVVYYTNSDVETPGIVISQGSNSVCVEKYAYTDNANVDINYTIGSDEFYTDNADVYITKGDGTTLDTLKDSMYELEIDTSSTSGYIWDYATVSDVTITPALTEVPTETTEYQITVNIVPKTDPASVAVIKSSIEHVSKTLMVTVHVDYSVELENFQNVSLDVKRVEANTDYVGTLTADAGHVLPDKIIVRREGTLVPSANYTYDSSTGKILIPEDVINKGNITIEAVATAKTYTLQAWYTTPNGTIVSKTKSYTAGTHIYPASETSLFVQPVAGTDYNEAEYSFKWDSIVQNALDGIAGKEYFEMPSNNIIVMGNFIPKTYDIIIRYVDANGNSIAADDRSNAGIAYESVNTLTAAELTGYKATGYTIETIDSEETVTGSLGEGSGVTAEVTMPASNVLVTFNYVRLQGEIAVTFIASDTGEALNVAGVGEEASYEAIYVANNALTTYEFDVPEAIANHVGYTVDSTALNASGKIEYTTNENCDGANIIIYCNPKTYDITFDANGGGFGTDDSITKTFQYNKPYSYTIDGSGTGSYGTFPTPVRAGYTLKGWDTVHGTDDTILVNQIKESDIVDGTVTKLYAKWEPVQYKLTVRFVDEDGASMGTDKVYELAYGTAYDVTALLGSDLPAIQPGQKTELGYSPGATGTMPAQNTVVTVTYYYETYDLIVKYLLTYSTGGNMETVEWYTEELGQIRYKEAYSIQKSFDDAKAYAEANSIIWPTGAGSMSGYEPLQETISGTMPIVEAGQKHVVEYTFINTTPVVSVTVDWGELLYTHSFDDWNPETHQYVETIQPNDEMKNYVKVTNNEISDINVDVSITYTNSNTTFSALNSQISLDDKASWQNTSNVFIDELGTKGDNASVTAWLNFIGPLWPDGNIPDSVDTTNPIAFGVLQVEITGGGVKK